MVGESIAILGILLCIIVVFVRSGHADYAISVTPILLVPAAQLLGVPVARLLYSLYGWPPYLVRCFVDVGGLAVACVLAAFFSLRIPSKKNKQLYLIITTLYCAALVCVYIYHLVAGI